MKQRCLNPNNKKYPIYGGRGIKVCKEWLKFENFRDDMFNTYFMHASIERINNNGNYEQKNCKWITLKEQAKNRNDNHYYSFNGKRMYITEWAKMYNIPFARLSFRLRNGWPINLALTAPIQKLRRKALIKLNV